MLVFAAQDPTGYEVQGHLWSLFSLSVPEVKTPFMITVGIQKKGNNKRHESINQANQLCASLVLQNSSYYFCFFFYSYGENEWDFTSGSREAGPQALLFTKGLIKFSFNQETVFCHYRRTLFSLMNQKHFSVIKAKYIGNQKEDKKPFHTTVITQGFPQRFIVKAVHLNYGQPPP